MVLQTFLLTATLVAPALVLAEEPGSPAPSAQPSTADPTPGADPSIAPTPSDDPTTAPTPDVAPAPVESAPAAPSAAVTPAPAPTEAPPAPPAVTYQPTGPPTIASDKADYAPGETVTLTGANWAAGESVRIVVNDTYGSSWAHDVTVVASATGGFEDAFTLPSWFVSNYDVTATGATSGTATAAFTDLSIGTYDQCANDDGDGYGGNPGSCAWINGNLQKNAAIYSEGDATVQRLWLTNFVPGSTHTVTFTYGTTKGGDHAYDFLTTWDWSEDWITVADRCSGITGCAGLSDNKYAIPADPNAAGFDTAAGLRQFVMRGGTLTGVSIPTIATGDYTTDSETAITVSFTVASSGAMCAADGTCGVVLWFGAHVALGSQWTLHNGTTGAASIPGSPYHVALSAVDGASVGKRDNQMQAQIVTTIPPGHITIIKDAVPNDPKDFGFEVTNSDTIDLHFSLDDDSDATLSNTTTVDVKPGTYTATELGLPIDGWSLTNLVCVDPTANTTVNLATGVATINLASGETVTCTYTNAKGGHIIVKKETTPDGATQLFEFDPSWSTTNFSIADGGSNDSGPLAAGTYSVAEVNVPTGWTKGTATCDDGSPVTAIELSSGETVTCTFNNSRDLGSLTIKKVIDYGPAAYNPDFKIDYDCDDGTAHDGTVTIKKDGSQTVTGIPTGTSCTVTEQALPTAPAGWMWDPVSVPYYTPDETVTIVTTPTAEVTVHNTLAKVADESTKLTLAKAVTGGTYTGPFTIHYDCGGSLVGDATVSVGAPVDITIPLYDGDTPLTTTCTISEPTLPSVPGWAFGTPKFSPSNTHTFSTSEPAAFTVTTNNTMATDLVVTKTAAGTYDRTYKWLIDKKVDDTRIEIAEGGLALFNYSVKVTPDGYTDSGWTLGGTITVTNPNYFDVAGVAVTDAYDIGACTVTGGTDVTIPAGGKVDLSYTCSFSGKPTYTGTNTATATWSKATYGTPTGTASGTADVALALKGETNRVITVVDDKTDSLNPVTLGTSDYYAGPFEYTYSLGKSGVAGTCTDYTNTAVIKETDQSDQQTVTVCVGKDLTVTKTAAGTYNRTYLWQISKGVDKALAKVAFPDSATFNYTVDVAQTGFTDAGWTLSGKITITNPNDWEAIMLTGLTDVVDNGGTCTVDPTLPLVPKGGSVDVNYSCSYASAPTSYSGTNTATATWNSELAFTPTGTASGNAGFALSRAGETNKTVHVTDTYGNATLGTVTATDGTPFATATFNYARTEWGVPGTCADYYNTSTITETGQTASQAVKVCVGLDPTVTKTAAGTFNRTYLWSILKNVDKTTVLIAEGGLATFKYTVDVAQTGISDAGWTLSGSITIANPNDWEAITLTGLSDVVDNGGTCTVDAGPYTIPAGQQISVGYSCAYATLPSSYSGTNTATATWDEEAYFTPNGTASGGAEFTLSQLGGTNKTVHVTDSYGGNLGEVTATDGPPYATGSFTYSRPETGVAGTCKSYDNTATITETKQSDGKTVVVCVGKDLVVTKTADPTFTRTWDWTVVKDGDATYNLFAGESVTHTYKVSVTPNPIDSAWKVTGTITITNPNDWEAIMLTGLTDVVDNGGTCTVDPTLPLVPKGGSVDVNYSCSYASAPTSSFGKNTATVSWDKEAAHTPSDSASGEKGFEFKNPTEINPVITVDDSIFKDEVWSTDRTYAEWTYTSDFSCSTNAGDYAVDGKYDYFLTNTASINETSGDSDSATVTVNCFAPVVSKTAAGTYDERHEWDVEKTVTPVSQSAFAGDTVSYEWKIVVTEQTFEENFKVAGEITVVNPAPMEMTVALADALGGGTAGAIGTCTNGTYADGSLTIPANTTAKCAYAALPGGRIDTVNNVTATLNEIDFLASATFGWAANVIRGSVTLDDDQFSSLPQTLTEGTTITYLDSATCSTTKTEYNATTHKYVISESNTAVLKDGETTIGSSTTTETIDCYVPAISKTANGHFDEVHDWRVNKAVNPTSQTAFAGQHKDFTWTVTVDEGVRGENYAVTGQITVVNPNPEDALVVELSDVLNDGTVAAIGPCTGGTWSDPNLTIPAGGTAVCDYAVTPKGDIAAFNAALPTQVSLPYIYFPTPGDDVYYDVKISGGPLAGTWGAWSVDTDTQISQEQYDPRIAYVYSTYVDLPPTGLVEHPENLDQVNWIINQGFVGNGYTYGDVQRAIWELLENDPNLNNNRLGTWSAAHVATIKAEAAGHGEDFVPTCGQYVAIILEPWAEGRREVLTLAEVSFATLNVNCAKSNTATATLNGIEYPASADIAWTKTVFNPTATLDDDQKPGWPTTVSSFTRFDYTDPQGYTCSTDPAAYTNGFYQYNESNTAVLTFGTESDTATASTAVKCYAPVVSKTAAGTYDERHEWDVEKSVDPTTQNAFAGDTVSYKWTVDVVETVFDENFVASGTISVKNPRPDDGNMNVKLTDQLSDGFAPTITGCTGGTWNATTKTVAVPPNTTAVCSYTATLSYNDEKLAPTNNTATAELLVGDKHLITTASDAVEWAATVIRGSATVDDDGYSSFPLTITDGGSWSYTQTSTCSTTRTDYGATSFTYTIDKSNTAIVTSGDERDRDTASTEVVCYWPQIELTKTGDTLSKIGDGVTYTIKLENKTPTDAGLRDLACTISDSTIGFSKSVTLASGASDTSDKSFTIPSGADDPFVNTASVTCKPVAATAPTVGSTTFSVSDTSDWSTNLFQPAVEIVKTGPAYATSGDVITYSFTITNKSSSDSPDLLLQTITDTVLGDLAAAAPAACDTLAYNASCSFTVDYTVPDVGLQPQTIKNIVTVHYKPDGFPNDITDSDDHTVVVTPRSQLTDTSFCPLPSNQFRLLYRLYSSPNTYLLNGSNPGQFYFNAFYFGAPGSDFSMTMQVPYPFMTQEGAGVPIQVHDGTGITSGGCYLPNPSMSGFTITTPAMTPTSASGNQIITPEDYMTKALGSQTTVTVSGTVPATGLVYVTIHLDYGLKKTNDWKPAGGTTLNPVNGNPYYDLWRSPWTTGAMTILGYQTYTFGRTVGGNTSTTTPSSYNEIKKFAGFAGFVQKTSTEAPLANAKIVIYDPKGVVLTTQYTDADGYYLYAYKHTAKAATYTVKLPAYSKSTSITVKANGFAAVDFDVP